MRTFGKRLREQIPELNTTSTADISFMLLIFFLMTSSMDTDKGLRRQMPPPPIEQQAAPLDVSKDQVVSVVLDADSRLTVDGEEATLSQLTDAVRTMASLNPSGHVITLQADRQTTYEAYYHAQDAIMKAYQQLRQQKGDSLFPMRVSELPVTDKTNSQ